MCSLALRDLGVEVVDSEDLDPLLGGRHLLLELREGPLETCFSACGSSGSEYIPSPTRQSTLVTLALVGAQIGNAR